MNVESIIEQTIAGMGYELVSTGGSAAAIEKAGLPVKRVEDLTGFPEMLDGEIPATPAHRYPGLEAIGCGAALRLWPAALRLRPAAAVSVAARRPRGGRLLGHAVVTRLPEARTASEAATAGVRACEAAEHSPGGHEKRTRNARQLLLGRLA